MIHLSGSVDLPAAVDDVFRWLDEPERLAALNPLPTTIVETHRLPNGGWFARSEIADVKGPIELITETVEYQPPTRTETLGKIKGRHPVRTTRSLTPIEGGTRVQVKVEYRVPVRALLVDRLYERRWKAMGQKALDETLARWAATFAR